MLADGILIRPVKPREILVDDHHLLRLFRVLIREDASTHQANAHRVEILGADPANVTVRPRITRRRDAPLNIEGA